MPLELSRVVKYRDRSRSKVTRGSGEGGRGGYCLMGTEFLFAVIKFFWKRQWWWLHSIRQLMTLNCTLYKWLKWPQIGGYFHTYTQHRRKHGGKQTPTDVSTEVGDKDRYRSKRVYEFSCENRNSSASPAESESLEIGILLLLSALYSSYPVFNVLHDLVLGLPTQHITTMNNPPQLSHAPH